jgi:hypothetical protein
VPGPADAAVPIIRVPLGNVAAAGLVHHEASGRIVVAAGVTAQTG